MSILKNLLKGLLVPTDSKPQTSSMTEDDLLKAIDALPSREEPEEDKVTGWYKDATWVKVPAVPCWSEFKYIGKPELKGLPEIEEDGDIYFNIPLGFEWGTSVKFWFITFPLNCSHEKVREFFTVVNPVEA